MGVNFTLCPFLGIVETERRKLILWTGKSWQCCKHFFYGRLFLNFLIISVLQNLLFCVPKVAVLHGKSVGFATQNSRFRNVKTQLSLFKRIIFTKPCLFSSIYLE